MRTKTLLLTAALTAAGIATSMAQVYSVNAVGYVKTTLKPGFNLISNPLTATSNKIADLFANTTGGIPDGLQVFVFNGAGFDTTTYDETIPGFDPADKAAVETKPGDGVFVRNPKATDITVTFVGEVPQGSLVNTLPKGLSVKSSQVPQAGTVTDLALPVEDGEQVFKFVAGAYVTSTYDETIPGWDPATPSIGVGEAFFLRKPTAGTWNRTFSVNQ